MRQFKDKIVNKIVKVVNSTIKVSEHNTAAVAVLSKGVMLVKLSVMLHMLLS